MNLALQVPMFGYLFLVFCAICVVLAIAVWILVKSGPAGTTKLNGSAGCAIACALVFVAGLMALGCAVVMVVNIPNEWLRRGPFKTIELHHATREAREHGASTSADESGGDTRDDAPTDASTPRAPDTTTGAETEVTVRFLLRDAGTVGEILKSVRELAPGDVTTSVASVQTDDGTFTEVLVRLRIPRSDFDEFKHDLEQEWPDFELPEGGKIELREPGE